MDPLLLSFILLFVIVPLALVGYRMLLRRARDPADELADREVLSLLASARALLSTRALRDGPRVAARLRITMDRLTMALSRRDLNDHPDLRNWLEARAAILHVLTGLERGTDGSKLATLARKARIRIARALARGADRAGRHQPLNVIRSPLR
jgi:hypothetical protein